MDDRHLLWKKFSSSLASLIWGQGGRAKKKGPFQIPHGKALTQSDQVGRLSSPDGGPPTRSHSSSWHQRPRKGLQGAGGKMENLRGPLIQAEDQALHTFSSPQQVALGNGLRDSSRDPKFETWLWTLIIIKRQTGNFQTMSC